MRRTITALGVGALALAATAFAPVTADTAVVDAPAVEQERSEIVVCVRFRDWEIPYTGITFEKPAERFCVETADVKVPLP